VTFEPFEDASAQPPVRGFLHRPARASRGGLVLGHGAGSDCNAPLLVALADAFAAEGLTVLRCDLPYRQARRMGPPFPRSAPLDQAGLRRAVLAVRRVSPGKVSLGGSSYGGRQASMLLAAEPELADSLLLLSYPLHPPGRPAELRTAHFPKLTSPTMFVHGSADPFASIEELDAARKLIPGRTALVVIDGAGHGLSRGPRASRPADDTIARIASEFLAFAFTPAPRLPPQELAARLERILVATERLIAEVPESSMNHTLPQQDRTVRDLAYHVFRLSLAFADAMDLGRLPADWLRQQAPGDLRDGRAIARYGALVRARIAGWFEGAGPREYGRTIDVYDGPRSGHDLLERTTCHAARHLRQIHVVLEGLGQPPREPLPTADFDGLPLPASLW